MLTGDSTGRFTIVSSAAGSSSQFDSISDSVQLQLELEFDII